MLPSDTSAEAAEVQRTGIRELPPLERLRKGCRLSNRGRRMALAAIRRCDPIAGEEEVRLRFIELAYGAALAGEVRRHLEGKRDRHEWHKVKAIKLAPPRVASSRNAVLS